MKWGNTKTDLAVTYQAVFDIDAGMIVIYRQESVYLTRYQIAQLRRHLRGATMMLFIVSGKSTDERELTLFHDSECLVGTVK